MLRKLTMLRKLLLASCGGFIVTVCAAIAMNAIAIAAKGAMPYSWCFAITTAAMVVSGGIGLVGFCTGVGCLVGAITEWLEGWSDK